MSGQIELKLEAFVNAAFEKHEENGQITKKGAAEFLKNLMEKHNGSWDEEKFNRIYNLFEDDGAAEEGAPPKVSGLDRGEFTKLVKRIAQL